MTADTLSLSNGVVSSGDPKQNSNASTKKSRESERRRRRRKQKKNHKASKASESTSGNDSDVGDEDLKENNDPQQVYLLIRFFMRFRVFEHVFCFDGIILVATDIYLIRKFFNGFLR